MKQGSSGSSLALADDKFKTLVSVAQDLQMPLRFMNDASGFVAENYNKLSKKQIVEYLEKINIETDSFMHLIDGIVKGYQWNQAKLKLSIQPTNIFLLADEVVDDLTKTSIHYGQYLSLESVRKLPLAVADRQALSLAIYNLTEMLLKHSPTESIIKLKLSRRRDLMCLSLKSSDLFISKLEIIRMLKQFAQFRAPSKTFASNSGMAVFVAKNIIESMSGRLDIVKFRRGCNFNIYLPVSNQQPLFALEPFSL